MSDAEVTGRLRHCSGWGCPPVAEGAVNVSFASADAILSGIAIIPRAASESSRTHHAQGCASPRSRGRRQGNRGFLTLLMVRCGACCTRQRVCRQREFVCVEQTPVRPHQIRDQICRTGWPKASPIRASLSSLSMPLLGLHTVIPNRENPEGTSCTRSFSAVLVSQQGVVTARLETLLPWYTSSILAIHHPWKSS